VWEENSYENSTPRDTYDGINSETHDDRVVEYENSKTSETPTITFSDQSTSAEVVNNPTPSKMGNAMSDAAPTIVGKQKKAKVFDEDIFLGPKKYMTRKIKSSDPYLHYENYLYRKVSINLYRCHRWMHPIRDNEWLTYNQVLSMVKYLNEKNDGKVYNMQSCPGVLEINRETHSATITTSHTCDMPHCKTPVATRANPPNDAVEGDLDPVNDLDNK
jgi:hypothetical protein